MSLFRTQAFRTGSFRITLKIPNQTYHVELHLRGRLGALRLDQALTPHVSHLQFHASDWKRVSDWFKFVLKAVLIDDDLT